jgi:hypothetical protein
MIGSCEHCGQNFNFGILHVGMEEMSYAYCNACGRAAILSCWSRRWPKGIKCTQAEIAREMEAHLKLCECGGKFAKGNSPRCPRCNQILSPEKAAEYIESQSPGARKGWRWQRTWNGVYCAVIEDRKVKDNFVD